MSNKIEEFIIQEEDGCSGTIYKAIIDSDTLTLTPYKGDSSWCKPDSTLLHVIEDEENDNISLLMEGEDTITLSSTMFGYLHLLMRVKDKSEAGKKWGWNIFKEVK